MKLTDYIIKFDNLFSSNLIKRIKSYIDIEKVDDMQIGNNVVNDQIRNVKGFSVHNFFPINKENATKWILFKLIAQQLSIIHLNYMMLTTKDINMEDNPLVQVDFLKYGEGGKYEVHVDAGRGSPRNLTTIINLNEEYEGGEFLFFNPDRKEIVKEVKLKTGSIIVFPSNFLYPHSVKPIIKGERYSIVCWTQ